MSIDRLRRDTVQQRKARAAFMKPSAKETAALKLREKAEAALEQKTARLRALRLAKAEADQEVALAKGAPRRKVATP